MLHSLALLEHKFLYLNLKTLIEKKVLMKLLNLNYTSNFVVSHFYICYSLLSLFNKQIIPTLQSELKNQQVQGIC